MLQIDRCCLEVADRLHNLRAWWAGKELLYQATTFSLFRGGQVFSIKSVIRFGYKSEVRTTRRSQATDAQEKHTVVGLVLVQNKALPSKI
jgi:hypothetical protein